jgi:DNA-binding transcriptional LysR family regulator
MDVLRAMHVFRGVATAGSFAAAARALEMTTAWASKQVSQLEAHLGTQLLNRNSRRLSLTDAGRLYLERCERILAEVGDAEESVGDLRSLPRGRLRISAPMSFGLQRLAPIFASFNECCPDIELDVEFSDHVVDLVESRFDLALRIGERLENSSLVARKLAGGRRILCASPAYLAARGVPRHPRELEHHACLRYALHATRGTWTFVGTEGSLVSVRVRGPLQANNSLAIREALLSGMGIGLVPDFVVSEHVCAGRLVPLLDGFEPSGYSLFAVCPPSRYAARKTRAFVDFLGNLPANALLGPPISGTFRVAAYGGTDAQAEEVDSHLAASAFNSTEHESTAPVRPVAVRR